MPTFSAPDGTPLAHHVSGEGPPLVCLPGGPTDSAYLGDLGGLSAHRRLIRLDPRGTGASAMPVDLASCRCDRLVDDVEALRVELGLARMDLLAHCAGANVAAQYVARYPERVGRLVLVTPSVRAVGLEVRAEQRVEVARLRSGEPWFAEAFAALSRAVAGEEGVDWAAITPFSHGRWDDGARALQARVEAGTRPEVVAAFGGEGAFSPEAVRAGLGTFPRTVLVLAGGVDVGAPPRVLREYAELFADATFVVQRGAGHHPWLDDPGAFVGTVGRFLTPADQH
ncbi:alpha/beta hydrolase [Streptomyces sp. J2-1]|uniref:alpha/beta fold hydrolase n=1 Tax=Streptomyces corallincola TaxID=2851888 RepID=UPI001C382532|nr:alpha/beta hydrolase [Streptomyces corallincola]MBV2354153.1 alpha/beta hydrolase [Streptomyces corallincola]